MIDDWERRTYRELRQHERFRGSAAPRNLHQHEIRRAKLAEERGDKMPGS